MPERQDFIDRLEARVREWSAQLDELRSRTGEAAAQGRKEAQKQIAALQEQRDILAGKLRELRESSKDALEGLREGTERAWEDMTSGLDEALGRLRVRAPAASATVARVDSIMTHGAEVCRPADSLNAAARILWERDFGCVPVVDEAWRVVGIVTDRDVCMTAYFRDKPLTQLRVGDCMSTDVVVCRPLESIEAVTERMKERQVRRLPVVDDEGRLVGVVSQNDVVRDACRDARGGRRTKQVRPERVIEMLAGIGEPRASRRA